MKTLKLSSLAIAALMLFTVACKKDKDSNGTNNLANNAHQFVDEFGPKAQLSTIDASTLPKTITLAGGTKVTIPAGGLKVGGVAVTGNITVQAIEVLKRSDVLFFGGNTNHISGAPLASDGFIYVDIKSNGVSVDRNLSVPLKIEIPAKRAGVTQLWEGVNANGVPLAPGEANQMAWQAPKRDVPNGGANGAQEVAPVNGFYSFNWGTTGWVNCDMLYAYTNPKTTVTVTVANNPGAMASYHSFSGETYVFFCAKNSPVAAQLYTPAGTNMVKSYDNTMPIGVEGKMLSFSVKDGKYYLASQEITISANQALTLTLVETSEAAVQAAISSLDTY
jgi:hypothetical protein